GPETFPKSLDVVKTYNRMQQSFPGKALPANVVVQTPSVDAPAARNAIAELERRALASGHAQKPITIDTNRDRTIANITVPIKGTGTDAASNASLAALRDAIVPETVGALPETEAGVTGLTAEWKDQQDQMKSTLPLVVGFVLLFAFGLMLVAFRSIVVASAAIVMVAVFSIFTTLSLLFFKQFGVGLAAAVLIDATLVRAVLLPATMKLLGDRNWYLPRWLEWLPRIESGEPSAAPEAPPAPVSA